MFPTKELEMELVNTKVAGRTMLTVNGQPVLIALVSRPARSAPSRVKCALVIPTEHDGEKVIAPLPFAAATLAPNGKTPRGFTPEFRLEMN